MNGIAPAAVGYIPNTSVLRPAAGGVVVSATGTASPQADAAAQSPPPAEGGRSDADDVRVRQAESALARAEARVLEQMQQEIRELAMRDREVRAHEQAHKAVGGQYAGAPSYNYQRGPDGRMYAIGGSVPIDISPIPGDPAATLQKMQQVQRAALAPLQPSAADRSIAAEAGRQMIEARAQLLQQQDDGASPATSPAEDETAESQADPVPRSVAAQLDDYRAVAASSQTASGISLTI